MSGKADKKLYTGILAEPMPKFTALTAPSDEELGGLIDTKMKALFAHYGIDSAEAYGFGPKMASTWADLAWHLAREHVPGFRGMPRKRGKPATRKADDNSLVMHVELLRRRDGLSDRKAVKSIAEQKLVPGTEVALLKRYKDAKKTHAPISVMFDNIEAATGHDAFVRIMEESLFGDDKETFLSPE